MIIVKLGKITLRYYKTEPNKQFRYKYSHENYSVSQIDAYNVQNVISQ